MVIGAAEAEIREDGGMARERQDDADHSERLDADRPRRRDQERHARDEQ